MPSWQHFLRVGYSEIKKLNLDLSVLFGTAMTFAQQAHTVNKKIKKTIKTNVIVSPESLKTFFFPCWHSSFDAYLIREI